MKKVTFIVLIATLAMFVLMSGVALAVGETPHGPFADDTTLCAACHRAHTAQSEYLLSESSTFNMCKACHSGGQGADADVDNGMYVVNGTWNPRTLLDGGEVTPPATDHQITVDDTTDFLVGQEVEVAIDDTEHFNVTIYSIDSGTKMTVDGLNHADTYDDNALVGTLTTSSLDHDNWGDPNEPMMGGGFASVEDRGGASTQTSTTSSHFDISNGDTYWGIQFGESTSPGTAITALDCVSCHLPHRSNNYRLLRQIPAGANADDTTAILVGDWLTRDGDGIITGDHQYTEDRGLENLKRAYDVTGSPDQVNSVNNEGISKWCGACHDFYYDNADKLDSDDAPSDAGAYYSQGTNFMHAIDVDLTYLPRNGSVGSTPLDLFDNLDEGGHTYADTLPVASDNAAGYGGDDEVTCVTCHRAHGTAEAMETDARLGLKGRLSLGAAGNDAAENLDDSMLLRIKNRGTCELCHNMPMGY